MFNLTDEQKAKAKANAIKSKEIFIYSLSLKLGIDPDSISLESNINLPDESAHNYASHIVLYNAIEDLKTLKG